MPRDMVTIVGDRVQDFVAKGNYREPKAPR